MVRILTSASFDLLTIDHRSKSFPGANIICTPTVVLIGVIHNDACSNFDSISIIADIRFFSASLSGLLS